MNLLRHIGKLALAGAATALFLSGCMQGGGREAEEKPVEALSTQAIAGMLSKAQEESPVVSPLANPLDVQGDSLFFGVADNGELDLLFTASDSDRVIQSVSPSPSRSVTVKGGDELEISAYVKDGAMVRAKLGDQVIFLDELDELDGDYRLYRGTFSCPEAEGEDQELGAFRVYAQWGDSKKAMNGACVTVRGLLSDEEDGEDGGFSILGGEDDKRKIGAIVTSDFAEVFPSNVLNDNSDPACYPLPQGTVDYISSKKLSFDFEDKTFYYYRLASGKRVYADDVKLFYTEDFEDNTISGIRVETDANATEVRVKMKWKAPFSCELSPLAFGKSGAPVSFSPTSFSITFDYTTAVPGKIPSFEDSPLFSGASWSTASGTSIARKTLTLDLRQRGVFMGVTSYYDGEELVFRFVNPPVLEEADNAYGYRLDGVRIFLDPGHDAKDPGAISYGKKVYEATLNRLLAARVKAELEKIGATVEIVDTAKGLVPMKDRLVQAREFSPHAYISLHHNSSEYDPKASGVESYYFNPYSMELAQSLCKRLGVYYDRKVYPDESASRNRGARFGYMYVTRYMDFTSALVEYGYISTPTELTFLMKRSVQSNFARYTVAGIVDYFAANAGEFAAQGDGTTGGKLSLIRKTGASIDSLGLDWLDGQEPIVNVPIDGAGDKSADVPQLPNAALPDELKDGLLAA